MHHFKPIPTIEPSKMLIEVAFSRARKLAISRRPNDNAFEAKRRIELAKIDLIKEVLMAKLTSYIQAFPSFDTLPPYFKALSYSTLDLGEVKHSLGAMQWACEQVFKFSRMYNRNIRNAQDSRQAGHLRQAYYGRVSSVIKAVSKELSILENARKTLKNFPVIKDGFTVCIVGFPNVGKSTLLKKLTNSPVEVAGYAFTTKSINIGYAEGIQLIDTPGSLNRPEKMNLVERQADLAMQHLAHAFVSVIDLTEPYPLRDQLELHRKVLSFKKPTVVYLSKTDILPTEAVEGFRIPEQVFSDANNLMAALKSMVK